MVTRIDRLTPAQAAQMPAHRDKWIKIGLSTDPMMHGDKWEVEQAIRAMYRRANLTEPARVIFVPSPFVLRVAAGIAAGAIHVIRNGWPASLGDAVDGAVRGAVRGAVYFLLRCAQQALYIEWGGNLWCGWTAWRTFFVQVCQLEIAALDELAMLETMHSRGGPFSLHSDFAMVSDRPRVLKRDAGGRLHSDSGPAIAYRDGWSLYFWHGLHIPRSHEWVIEQSGKLTPDAIEAEPNAELRRVMLEVFGFENYLAQRKAKVIAADELHGQPRRLLEINVGGEKLQVTEVHNGSLEPDGTRRRFHLGAARDPRTRKPPRTPHEAVAHSYGIAPKHYREAVRT